MKVSSSGSTVRREAIPELEFRELSAGRWADLEALFGDRGGCGGCWCMWWRLKRSQFDKQKGAANRKAFKRIVDSGQVPGVLAYAGGKPVGWCAVEPREIYPVLERSRVLERVDDRPVWSIVCLFVARPFRRKGVSGKLIRAALQHARGRGARVVEGYPIDPKKGGMADAFAWTGLASAFRQAGFVEVLRRSPTRPLMRYIFK